MQIQSLTSACVVGRWISTVSFMLSLEHQNLGVTAYLANGLEENLSLVFVSLNLIIIQPQQSPPAPIQDTTWIIHTLPQTCMASCHQYNRFLACIRRPFTIWFQPIFPNLYPTTLQHTYKITLPFLSTLFCYHCHHNTSRVVDTSNAHLYFVLPFHFYTPGNRCFPPPLYLSSSWIGLDHMTNSRQITVTEGTCHLWAEEFTFWCELFRSPSLAAATMGVCVEIEVPQDGRNLVLWASIWRTAASGSSMNSSSTLCTQEINSYHVKKLRFPYNLLKWHNMAYPDWYTILQDLLWSRLWSGFFFLFS